MLAARSPDTRQLRHGCPLVGTRVVFPKSIEVKTIAVFATQHITLFVVTEGTCVLALLPNRQAGNWAPIVEVRIESKKIATTGEVNAAAGAAIMNAANRKRSAVVSWATRKGEVLLPILGRHIQVAIQQDEHE